jgi:hypothetical protein
MRVRSGAYGLLALALVAGGCDGGSSTPAAPVSGAPALANLVAVFLDQPCTTPLGQAGTTLSLAVGYSDPEGDVRGGRLATDAGFEPSTASGSLSFRVPDDTASTTGTTSGTIQVFPCLRFGTDTAVTMSATLFDATGAVSNTLTSRLDRPAGAP